MAGTFPVLMDPHCESLEPPFKTNTEDWAFLVPSLIFIGFLNSPISTKRPTSSVTGKPSSYYTSAETAVHEMG